jgi:hypothetical protein
LAAAAAIVTATLNHPDTNAVFAAPPSSPVSGPNPPPPSPALSRSASARPSPTTVTPNRPNCAAKPSGCGLPDATNTGVPAGTRLTVVTGDLTVTKAGTVVDGKDIRGCVLVKAPNVTIRRSRVACPSFYVIGSFTESYRGGGLLVEDVEVDCKNTQGTGIGSYGLTARRVNIHSCENGFDLDTDVTVVDSYIHDLYLTAAGHPDGIQLAIGVRVTISHNTIFDPGGTSAIISHPSTDSDVLVSGNLMAGGAYTLYCPRDSSRDYRVIDNRFSTLFSPKSGEYGPWTDCEKVAVVRGNVWDNTLQPVR